MATAVREFSLDYYLLDRLRFSGLDKENLNDLISIVTSLKNKYGIFPFAVQGQADPIPNAILVQLAHRYHDDEQASPRAAVHTKAQQRHGNPAGHPAFTSLRDPGLRSAVETKDYFSRYSSRN
jgi:hypothetical protein